MNPISTVTGVITHPRRTAESVAGATFGVASAGLRTTARVVGWAVERSVGRTPEPSDASLRTVETPTPATTVPRVSEAEATAGKTAAEKTAAKKTPARKTAAKKTAAKKTPARKTGAKKAASKKAAVVAPALGLTEAEVVDDELRTPSGIPAAGEGYNPDTTETDLHQPGTEPLMDPATVKAAASEAEMMQRAADPDKG